MVASSEPLSNKTRDIVKWGIATLITMTADKRLDQHAITYTQQAVLLGQQLCIGFPGIPLLAVILADQVGVSDIQLLESAGYKALLRPALHPAYVSSKQMLAHVYYDQYMKFWLWNETDYDYLVYFDSDTFFRNAHALDFTLFFPSVTEQRVVACPTPWSHADNRNLPVTWNGGFFIIQPSSRMFDRLVNSRVIPSHFLSEYGPDKQWFDVSEMGAFMRDFPDFTTPSPIEDYCSEIRYCCVQAVCEPRFKMQLSRGNMIHGLKPDGHVLPGSPRSSIFDNQRLNVFAGWGYDPSCLLKEFYEPLTQLLVEHALL